MRVLFLGYGNNDTNIIAKIREKDWVDKVDHSYEEVTEFSEYDLVICYGYKYIITETCFASLKRPILNLHISYLPYNRGRDPNFWSFVENTPKGISIHEIDKGVNSGLILYQKYVNFDQGEDTFNATYSRLRAEADMLFLDNLDPILKGDYRAIEQRGLGTYHVKEDLPEGRYLGDVNIDQYLDNYDQHNHGIKPKLAIVDEIEKIRTHNNVNWMDLLRLAIKSSPTKAKKLITRINNDDNEISKLFGKLGK